MQVLLFLVIVFILPNIYADNPKNLNDVKGSLQSLINDTQSNQSTTVEGKTKAEKSGATEPWFLQHQRAWDVETEEKAGEKNQAISEEGEKTPKGVSEVNTQKEGASWLYYIFRTIVALVLVLGLLLLVLGSMRFFVQKGASKYGKRLGKVLGVIYLSPRARVYYLQTAGKVVALGVSGDRISLLFSMNEDDFFSNLPDVEEPEEGKAKTFRRVLEDVEQRIKEKSLGEESTKVSQGFDDDIASLKANIQKLQEALREDSEGEEGK